MNPEQVFNPRRKLFQTFCGNSRGYFRNNEGKGEQQWPTAPGNRPDGSTIMVTHMKRMNHSFYHRPVRFASICQLY